MGLPLQPCVSNIMPLHTHPVTGLCRHTIPTVNLFPPCRHDRLDHKSSGQSSKESLLAFKARHGSQTCAMRRACRHEYTQSNACFARAVEAGNEALAQRADEIARLRRAKQPTVRQPSALYSLRLPYSDCPPLAAPTRCGLVSDHETSRRDGRPRQMVIVHSAGPQDDKRLQVLTRAKSGLTI